MPSDLLSPKPAPTPHFDGRDPGAYARTGFLISASVFMLDQANKWAFVAPWGLGLIEGERHRVLPFLDLIYLRNKGISYGMFQADSQQGQMLLAAFAFIVSIGLAIWIARAVSQLTVVGLALILGGALGNGLDRLTLGGVADFYQLHWGSFYWYVFNLADVAIVVGAALLLYEVLMSRDSAANAA